MCLRGRMSYKVTKPGFVVLSQVFCFVFQVHVSFCLFVAAVSAIDRRARLQNDRLSVESDIKLNSTHFAVNFSTNCLIHLIAFIICCHPLVALKITSRLRRAITYPRPRNRTNCYKSFIHHALLTYQPNISVNVQCCVTQFTLQPWSR